MESENARVLRRLEEHFNSRDLDAYVELLDPDVEWHVAPEDPDTTVHRGREEVRAYLESWINSFSDLQIQLRDVRDADGRALTDVRFVGHGTESGAPLDERIASVFSLRAGRVTKVEDLGRDQASTK